MLSVYSSFHSYSLYDSRVNLRLNFCTELAMMCRSGPIVKTKVMLIFSASKAALELRGYCRKYPSPYEITTQISQITINYNMYSVLNNEELCKDESGHDYKQVFNG